MVAVLGVIGGGFIGAIIGSKLGAGRDTLPSAIIAGGAIGALVGAAVGDALQRHFRRPTAEEAREMLIARSKNPDSVLTRGVSPGMRRSFTILALLVLIGKGCAAVQVARGNGDVRGARLRPSEGAKAVDTGLSTATKR